MGRQEPLTSTTTIASDVAHGPRSIIYRVLRVVPSRLLIPIGRGATRNTWHRLSNHRMVYHPGTLKVISRRVDTLNHEYQTRVNGNGAEIMKHVAGESDLSRRQSFEITEVVDNFECENPQLANEKGKGDEE